MAGVGDLDYMEDTRTPPLPVRSPRIIQQMQKRNEAEMVAQEASEARERQQENISLNTRRDIRCYVMTEAELASLLVSSTLISVCSCLPAFMLAVGLMVVIYNPVFKDIVGAAVTGVVVLGVIGNVVAHYWRNSIVKAIRGGANFDAQR
jgi:hypothetical protein